MKIRTIAGLIIAACVSVVFTRCTSEKKRPSEPSTELNDSETGNADNERLISHYNITIASDLSNRVNNRINPRPLTDTAIVDLIIDDINPRILRHKRDINQQDVFRFDFINKKQISVYDVNSDNLLIDFSAFKNQQQRIEFIRKDFNLKKEAFKKEFANCYVKAQQSHYGSDIWTYFQTGIDENVIKKLDSTKDVTSIGDTKFKNTFKNVLILLTDGYIEAGIYGKNYDLSANTIKKFREAFLKSGGNSLKAFYDQHPEFHIKAVDNPALKDLDILVLEINDRTLTAQGATIHPTDYEIMKLFWIDWLKRSGTEKIELYQKFANKAEANKAILKFLGIS